MAQNNISIEVVFASETAQKLIRLDVVEGTTIADAIAQSGILELFPEINLDVQRVGIFSKQKKLTDIVNAGDRIEIYRPLTIDPMELRRAKAKKKLD